MYFDLLSAPVTMYGGGNYKLVAVKEIKTTESFHSLREDQKNCQTLRTFEECVADLLLEIGTNKCNCTPYELLDLSDNRTFQVNNKTKRSIDAIKRFQC